MEQPPEEAPEVREEEEKEEVAETQGAPELNGGPEGPLPSSSYAGERGRGGAARRREPGPLRTASRECRVTEHEPDSRGSHPRSAACPQQGPGHVVPPVPVRQTGIVGTETWAFVRSTRVSICCACHRHQSTPATTRGLGPTCFNSTRERSLYCDCSISQNTLLG